jgi:uncharacterized protein (DUF2384 family)
VAEETHKVNPSQWLRTPVPSLGDTPIALLRTAEGAAKVEDALLAIEDGAW